MSLNQNAPLIIYLQSPRGLSSHPTDVSESQCTPVYLQTITTWWSADPTDVAESQCTLFITTRKRPWLDFKTFKFYCKTCGSVFFSEVYYN